MFVNFCLCITCSSNMEEMRLWMWIAGAIINSDSVIKLEDFIIYNYMYSSWNEKEILMCYQYMWLSEIKTDTPDSATRAGVRSRSTESGDIDEHWINCFTCIYVIVQYDLWLKCKLWGNMFPPTLGGQCGWGVCLHVNTWYNRTEELSCLSLPPRISATEYGPSVFHDFRHFSPHFSSHKNMPFGSIASTVSLNRNTFGVIIW